MGNSDIERFRELVETTEHTVEREARERKQARSMAELLTRRNTLGHRLKWRDVVRVETRDQALRLAEEHSSGREVVIESATALDTFFASRLAFEGGVLVVDVEACSRWELVRLKSVFEQSDSELLIVLYGKPPPTGLASSIVTIARAVDDRPAWMAEVADIVPAGWCEKTGWPGQYVPVDPSCPIMVRFVEGTARVHTECIDAHAIATESEQVEVAATIRRVYAALQVLRAQAPAQGATDTLCDLNRR